MLSSLNAVISTNESTEFITGLVIYNPAYYKFQLKTTFKILIQQCWTPWSIDIQRWTNLVCQFWMRVIWILEWEETFLANSSHASCNHKKTWIKKLSIWKNDKYVFVTAKVYWGLDTLPTAEILCGKNVRAFLVCGFLMKSFKKKYPENMKKIVGAVWKILAK